MSQSIFAVAEFVEPLVTKRGDDSNSEEFVMLADPPHEARESFDTNIPYLVTRRIPDFLESILDVHDYLDPYSSQPFSTFPGKNALMTEFFTKSGRYLINTWPDFHRAWAKLVDCMNLIYMFAEANPHVPFESFYKAHIAWIEYCNSRREGYVARFSSRCRALDEIFLRYTGVVPALEDEQTATVCCDFSGDINKVL
ncbi:hypothetical protein HDU98_005764 [Podochytrium sp. JEL0797]|nr:hypothetical protein HDU98_005764 [Podochytrium sp. JEL0797]